MGGSLRTLDLSLIVFCQVCDWERKRGLSQMRNGQMRLLDFSGGDQDY